MLGLFGSGVTYRQTASGEWEPVPIDPDNGEQWAEITEHEAITDELVGIEVGPGEWAEIGGEG